MCTDNFTDNYGIMLIECIVFLVILVISVVSFLSVWYCRERELLRGLRFVAVTHEVSKNPAIGVAHVLKRVVLFKAIKSVRNAEGFFFTHENLMRRLQN